MALPQRNRNGIALLASLFFGLLCLGLAAGFLLRVPVDLVATTSLDRNTRSAYVAEAAVQDTMAWISHELTNAREPCTTSSPSPVRSGTLDGWDWTCRIEPDPGTPPNSLTSLRLYKLTATVSQDGIDRYRVVTDVQAGQSFARFSIFLDNDGFITYDFIVTKDSRVRGPIHKNRPINFLIDGALLSSPSPGPVLPFDSLVTTTAATHQWYSGGSSSSQLSNEQYDNIFSNGAADLHYNVAPRPMPSDSNILAQAAWGGAPPAFAPISVTANPMGGVYIEGDVTEMLMSVNGSGQFVLTINQGGQITTVVEDTVQDQRLVTGPGGSTAVVPGVGTGVIFTTGNIRSLKGENKGPHTIATRFENGKNIEISGSITRNDTPVGSEPTGSADRLGLVASTIHVADETVLPRNVNNPLRIYSTILATHIFEVKNRKSGNPGALAIYGGMASKLAWATVSFNNLRELRTTHGYGGLSGFGSANIYYDKLLADEPPPEYPTTAATELKVRSWREHPL